MSVPPVVPLAAPRSARPLRVIVAGGGVAGVTALMALHELDPGGRLSVELVAPRGDFVLSPQLLGEPWGGPPMRSALAPLAADHGAAYRQAAVTAVDPARRVLTTDDGEQRGFDALVLATGGRPYAAFPGVTTVGVDRLPVGLARAECGSVAVVVPVGTAWTLPAYQLALLAAGSGAVPAQVLTPERRPLALFGPGARGAVSDFLLCHGVQAVTGVALPAGVPPTSVADTVLALPSMRAVSVTGLPTSRGGFLPVDQTQRVRGLREVFAAGDATDGPLKHGGLAARQAELAARAVARLAGLTPPPWLEPPALRGKLVAGADTLYLRRDLEDALREPSDDGFRGDVDPGTARDTPLWQPEAALVAWRLSTWLQAQRRGHGASPLGPVARPAPVVSAPA